MVIPPLKMGGLPPDLGLNAVELSDPAQAVSRDFRTVAVEDLLQLAPRMRPAVGHRDRRAALAGGARQSIVTGISIQLQDAVEALQDLLGMGASTAWAIGEDHAGRVIAAPSTIIPGKRPEVAGLGSAASGVEDRRRRLVHEEPGRSLQVLGQPVDHRAEVERGCPGPVRQGAAVDLDAGAGKDLVTCPLLIPHS